MNAALRAFLLSATTKDMPYIFCLLQAAQGADAICCSLLPFFHYQDFGICYSFRLTRCIFRRLSFSFGLTKYGFDTKQLSSDVLIAALAGKSLLTPKECYDYKSIKPTNKIPKG